MCKKLPICIRIDRTDIIKEADAWEIHTAPDKLNAVIVALKNEGVEARESGLQYLSKNDVAISDQEGQRKIESFYNLLDALDDVSAVYTNANW